MTEFNESIEDNNNELDKKCLKGWFDSKIDLNLLGHHSRMIKATKSIQARREFIDGHSTDN